MSLKKTQIQINNKKWKQKMKKISKIVINKKKKIKFQIVMTNLQKIVIIKIYNNK